MGGKNFLEEWEAYDSRDARAARFDLFSLLERTGLARVDASWIEQNDPTGKHFYLPQTAVDFEKALPGL